MSYPKMVPAYERKSNPPKMIDGDDTTTLQGNGLNVVRVERVVGSDRAFVTWRNPPGADEIMKAESLLTAGSFAHTV